MADQTFNCKCGFFDAINDDRLYTADDMSLLFDRLVANGVFATPQGTPSTDLQVLANGTTTITVKKGAGIFANKWFRNQADILIPVPSNSAANTRIDSVIVQVDLRSTGRAGNVVYRTGTAASSPEPPAINTITDIKEYRIANISVTSNAASITNADVTDLRGSSECLWVTSLIQQVDTATLWEQFNAAYAEQFRQYQIEFADYIELQRQAWDEFLSTLTEDLTVSTDVATYTSTYTALSTVTNIPINIASFNYQTDVLHVYINGLYAASDKYTLNVNRTSIDLTTPISAGNSVYFVVFKSLVGAGNESVVTLIERLNDRVSEELADSRWHTLTLQNGAVAYDADDPPKYRAIGKIAFLRGSFKGLTDLNTTIGTLPINFRPGKKFTFAVITDSGAAEITITASGLVQITKKTGSIADTDEISLCTNYVLETYWP